VEIDRGIETCERQAEDEHKLNNVLKHIQDIREQYRVMSRARRCPRRVLYCTSRPSIFKTRGPLVLERVLEAELSDGGGKPCPCPLPCPFRGAGLRAPPLIAAPPLTRLGDASTECDSIVQAGHPGIGHEEG